MKKRLIISGFIISSGFAITGGVYADTASTEMNSLVPVLYILSPADTTTLESLTGSARIRFLRSNRVTKPLEGSGWFEHGWRSEKNTNSSALGRTISLNTTSTTRTTRIEANQAKVYQRKLEKLQKKVSDKETLTRLEKKFATANGIEYS